MEKIGREVKQVALQGAELIVILLVVVVILLWGPKKLPELARGVGEAKKEFEKASREEPASAEKKKEEDMLLETAHKLGISTEGKTREEISQEIVKKAESGRK